MKVQTLVDKAFDTGQLVISNAFSLNMLECQYSEIEVYRVDYETAKEFLKGFLFYGLLISNVLGHQSTVNLWNKLFPFYPLEVNRVPVKFKTATVLVIQPTERLPEGKVLDDTEIQRLLKEEKVNFFLVFAKRCLHELGEGD